MPLDLFYDYRTNPAPHSRLRPQLGGEELPEITSRRSLTLLTGERECTRERKEEAMGTVSRGFKGRRPSAELPAGQYLVEDFPILSAGPTPSIDRLRDHGQEG